MSVPYLLIVAMTFGAILGWVWRSVCFVHDRDCANPDHKKDLNEL